VSTLLSPGTTILDNLVTMIRPVTAPEPVPQGRGTSTALPRPSTTTPASEAAPRKSKPRLSSASAPKAQAGGRPGRRRTKQQGRRDGEEASPGPYLDTHGWETDHDHGSDISDLSSLRLCSDAEFEIAPIPASRSILRQTHAHLAAAPVRHPPVHAPGSPKPSIGQRAPRRGKRPHPGGRGQGSDSDSSGEDGDDDDDDDGPMDYTDEKGRRISHVFVGGHLVQLVQEPEAPPPLTLFERLQLGTAASRHRGSELKPGGRHSQALPRPSRDEDSGRRASAVGKPRKTSSGDESPTPPAKHRGSQATLGVEASASASASRGSNGGGLSEMFRRLSLSPPPPLAPPEQELAPPPIMLTLKGVTSERQSLPPSLGDAGVGDGEDGGLGPAIAIAMPGRKVSMVGGEEGPASSGAGAPDRRESRGRRVSEARYGWMVHAE
jgi:hypothetical protein